MPKIEGINELRTALSNLLTKSRKEDNVSVSVGYTANYALWVHENTQMKLKGQPRPKGRGNYWDPPGRGQSKFLEEPARTKRDDIIRVVKEVALAGGSLSQALAVGGMRLIRESSKLVPVNVGNLKNSWFVRKDPNTIHNKGPTAKV